MTYPAPPGSRGCGSRAWPAPTWVGAMVHLGAFWLLRVWVAGVARSYVGRVQWSTPRFPVVAGVGRVPA
jgi:hypothetical protein